MAIQKSDYENCSNVSVDNAVLEKSTDVDVIPSDIKWADVGSWEAIFDQYTPDTNANVMVGNVVSRSTKNTFVFAKNGW